MLRLLIALALALGAPAARADRPFIATTTAVMEDDDDRVWSIATAFEARRGRARELSLAAEYAFDPEHSVEFVLGAARVGSANGYEAEIEFKKLFNDIARDGWGVGLVASIGGQREPGERFRGGGWSVGVPLSLQRGDAFVHANVGLAREPGDRRRTQLAIGAEAEVARRVVAYAEWARVGEARLAHAGVRWWVRRERFAVDVGATRRREDDASRSGVALALSWYDL